MGVAKISFCVEELFISLKEDLEGHRREFFPDGWGWKLEEGGAFSVRSCYLKLVGLMSEEQVWSVEEKGVLETIWKSKAPLKVIAFTWKLFLDRIPTRNNLALRNCLPAEESTLCVLCGRTEESSNHLFLHCIFAEKVWESVMKWLDFSFITPPNLFVHWACWCNEGRNKKIRKGYAMIWHATIWVI